MSTLSILIAGVLVAAGPTDEALKKELAQLQGTWTVVSSEQKGGPHRDTLDARFVFAGAKLTVTLKGEQAKEPFTITIDPSKAPHWIDSGKLGQGIYSLEGDQLKLCFGQKERPREFNSKDGYLFVLKREKQ